MDLKWPEMLSKVNFGHPKWPINLKWPEMRSKVIFRHPKWPPKKYICINLQWPDIQISDIQNGRRQPFCQKFQKKLKLLIDMKWPEMRSKVISDIQNGRRQPFCKKNHKNKNCGKKCDTKLFLDIQNGYRRPF